MGRGAHAPSQTRNHRLRRLPVRPRSRQGHRRMTNEPGMTLLKAQMNADLLTEDLKKKRASNECFWLIGQPDVRLRQIKPATTRASSRSRSTASTTTTPQPAPSSPAAPTRSPCGCSTPTTTAAASIPARSSSRWPAKRKAGRKLAKQPEGRDR